MGLGIDVHSLIAGRVTVGTSQILGITVIPGLNAILIKYHSGGSLEILGTTTQTWGDGYLFSVGEAVAANFAGNFYLAATGATVVAYLLRGRSPGFE